MDAAEFKRALDSMDPAERRRMFDEFDELLEQPPKAHREPNLADPAEAAVHRAIGAIQRAFKEEYGLDAQVPNVTVVVAVPPDGRIGVATTEPDEQTALFALRVGWGALHRVVRLGR